jgi:hypothetical protein
MKIGLDTYGEVMNTWGLSGHYMYHQFNIHNSTCCSHNAFMCFVCISEQTAIISLNKINWLVFITETGRLLRGTDWVFIYNASLNKNLRSAHTLYLCVLFGSQNKQPLFPYTALGDWFLYSACKNNHNTVDVETCNSVQTVSHLCDGDIRNYRRSF